MTMSAALANTLLLGDLQPGDLVEFPRGIYSHWGVYVGDGKVAHLAGEDDDGINNVKPEHFFSISGVKFDKAKVCVENLLKVAEGSRARKNNNTDSKLTPLRRDEIVRRATRRLGEVGYSLIYSNCEHFAKWCRYNVEKSDQVDNVVTGVAVASTFAITAAAVYGLIKFWGSSEKEEEEKEQEY